MYKQIRLKSVHYEMLLEVAKKNRLKAEDILAKLIESAYK